MLPEYTAVILASVLLVTVLIACYMTMQLYDLRRPEGFISEFAYSPTCDPDRTDYRDGCRGLTIGAMPAIETESVVGCGDAGCNLLGVPV